MLDEMSKSIVDGNMPEVKRLTEEFLEQGIKPEVIVNKGLIPGMDIVGIRFKKKDISVPEVLMSARAMHASLEILKPLLSRSDMKPLGVIAIGTVKGDIHDIGKNLVAMMLEGAGFHVIDVGIDVPSERFVEIVRTKKPDILGLSALLNATLSSMKEVIKALESVRLREDVKVMVGGAPVTQEFADEIGADAYAGDAREAVVKAKEILGIK
ncbi:MAG: corrinoid protein [Methanocellales archaeon]|nr:corrinoid protein [Methanocellales archaeon]MDD3420778.1 corrinoid protein [Methanocellales archaeon]MDD4898446.1 corrinoid protein [Methanocellales archaeon]